MTVDVALGIDLGTTSTKVVALDGHGAVVASSTAQHGIIEHADRVEADPARWEESVAVALASLSLPLGRVVAVGLSGNMSSVVLVDEALTPVRPALLLADRRGAEQLAALTPATSARITASGGNAPQTVFSLASLLWLRDAGELVAGRTYLCAKDWLRARLTGIAGTELTDAANSLLVRVADGRPGWDLGLSAELGVPASLLPPLGRSGDPAGAVSEQAASWSGLPVGVPVAFGAGDVAAALVGGGGLGVDELAVSLGTSATLTAGLTPGENVPAGLTGHPDADGGRYVLGSLLTGGLALNWLRNLVGPAALQAAGDLPHAAGGTVLLPHLTGTGSPDHLARARGTVFGITPGTDAAALVSALLQSIAFELAELVDALGRADSGGEMHRRVVLSGGGTNVAGWPQIIADVLGVPARVLNTTDLSAVGAAVLGWRGCGRVVAPPVAGRDILPRRQHAGAWAARRREYTRARADAQVHYLAAPPDPFRQGVSA